MPIEPERSERWPQHRADEQHFTAILGLGEAEETPGLTERDPVVYVAADHGRVSPAFDAEHDRPASARRDGIGERAGKAATAANDGKRSTAGRVSHNRFRRLGSSTLCVAVRGVA